MTAIRPPIGRVALAIAATALALLVLTAGSTAATDGSVSIVFRSYQPALLSVEAGATVTWKNNGLTPHTVTADGGQFDSGRMNAGTSFSVTFNTPGSFAYSCTIHPTMHGTVIVRPAGAPASPPPAGAPSGAPAQSVRIRLSRAHGRHGTLILVHVQAPRPGAKVLLELRSGPAWRTARRARLNAQGRATLSVAAGARRRLRVVVAGSGGEPALISRAVRPAA
jgi:plastocyanin